MSIPTLMLFKNGEVVNQLVGARPKAELVKLLENA
jgi:thioredoxin-like negative regulator of GroEL